MTSVFKIYTKVLYSPSQIYTEQNSLKLRDLWNVTAAAVRAERTELARLASSRRESCYRSSGLRLDDAAMKLFFLCFRQLFLRSNFRSVLENFTALRKITKTGYKSK